MQFVWHISFFQTWLPEWGEIHKGIISSVKAGKRGFKACTVQGPSAGADRNSWAGGVWASLREGGLRHPSEAQGTDSVSNKEPGSVKCTRCVQPLWGSQRYGLEGRAALTKNWTQQLSQLVGCPQGGLRGAAAVVFMHQHTEMLGKGWDSSTPSLPANRWVIRRRPEPDAALPPRPAPEGMAGSAEGTSAPEKGYHVRKRTRASGFLGGRGDRLYPSPAPLWAKRVMPLRRCPLTRTLPTDISGKPAC